MEAYSIIKADLIKDKDTIISLLMADNRTISDKLFEWKYYKYPYEAPDAWLIKHNKSNKIIGANSLFSRRISINGKLVSVATAADFVMDKKHRSLFPALKLEQEKLAYFKKSEYHFIYCLSNKFTKPVFDRLGYKKIGNYKQFVKPIKINALSNKYLPSLFHYQIIKKIIDFFLLLVSRENLYKQ